MFTPNTAPRSAAQNAQFHRLLTQHGFETEEKAELVYLVSQGRTRSSKELTYREMQLAIDRLAANELSSIKKMRAKCYEVYRDVAGLPPKDKYTFVQRDYDAVDAFTRRCFKKPLRYLTYAELPDCVTAFVAWRDWGLDKAIQHLLTHA